MRVSEVKEYKSVSEYEVPLVRQISIKEIIGNCPGLWNTSILFLFIIFLFIYLFFHLSFFLLADT